MLFLFLLMNVLASAQSEIRGDSVLQLTEGFKHRLIYKLSSPEREVAAHLFSMEVQPQNKVRFVSRKLFQGDFNYTSIEEQCRQQGKEIVLQVAAAFTPDWNVIEGFALQQGKKVGQDSFPGQNSKLPYKGILVIKKGLPFFTHLDSIKFPDNFVEKARSEQWSLFLQAAPIVKGKLDTFLILPGSHKRRFFVEFEADKKEFGVVTFLNKTTYLQAVKIMYGQKDYGINIKNAVYLDMGSVSQGYVYDKNGKKYLIGNPGTFMHKYTNMLVMNRE